MPERLVPGIATVTGVCQTVPADASTPPRIHGRATAPRVCLAKMGGIQFKAGDCLSRQQSGVIFCGGGWNADECVVGRGGLCVLLLAGGRCLGNSYPASCGWACSASYGDVDELDCLAFFLALFRGPTAGAALAAMCVLSSWAIHITFKGSGERGSMLETDTYVSLSIRSWR